MSSRSPDFKCPNCGTAVVPKVAERLVDGMWTGKPVFILGGGPSLGNHLKQLGELADYGRVIATNRAIELPVEIDMWCWVDDRVFRHVSNGRFGPDIQRKFYLYDGIYVTRTVASRTVEYPDYVIRIKSNPGNELGESFGSYVNTHSNIGFFALNMAYLLGADPIILLGYDQRGDLNDRNQWWHDGYPGEPNKSASRAYTVMRGGFLNAANKMKAEGRRLWNASPGSTLDFIENIDTLNEVFARLQTEPILIEQRG